MSAPAPGSVEKFITIGDRVYFDLDKAEIQRRNVDAERSSRLVEYPNITIVVEGHADERGTREYNLALGERRANAVKEYRQPWRFGEPDRNRSYGKERPAVWARTIPPGRRTAVA